MGKRRIEPETIFGALTGIGIACVLLIILYVAERKEMRAKIQDSGGNVAVGFDPPLFDFGTVPQAHLVQHEFRLVNRGTNNFSISLVRASCECTVLATNFVGKVLEAGEELKVPVTLESEAREGEVSSSILFVLDSPSGKYKAEAKLQGRVAPEFFVGQSSHDFGVLYPGQSATNAIWVRQGRLSGAPLKETKMNVGPFDALVRDHVNADEGKTNSVISLTFSAPHLKQRKQFSKQLKLETHSKRVPNVEIAVKAAVVPEIEITPDVIVLPSMSRGGESRIRVRTIAPSRIVRMLLRSGDKTRVVEGVESGHVNSEWMVDHRLFLENSALANATALDVELEVRRDAGGIEARSASIKIQSLATE